MIKKHPSPKRWKDVHFEAWHIAYCEHIKDLARDVVREFKAHEEKRDARQPLFPGFKRLQKFYQIEQSGEPTIVPTADMTDEELEFKAKELEAIGKGNIEHANEIRRYVAARRAAA